MTVSIQIPKRRKNLGDRILVLLGKEPRRLLVPYEAIDRAYDQLGHAAYLAPKCTFESFWKALMRPSRSIKDSKHGG